MLLAAYSSPTQAWASRTAATNISSISERDMMASCSHASTWLAVVLRHRRVAANVGAVMVAGDGDAPADGEARPPGERLLPWHRTRARRRGQRTQEEEDRGKKKMEGRKTGKCRGRRAGNWPHSI